MKSTDFTEAILLHIRHNKVEPVMDHVQEIQHRKTKHKNFNDVIFFLLFYCFVDRKMPWCFSTKYYFSYFLSSLQFVNFNSYAFMSDHLSILRTLTHPSFIIGQTLPPTPPNKHPIYANQIFQSTLIYSNQMEFRIPSHG